MDRFCYLCLSLPYCHNCFLQPCCYLLENDYALFSLVCDVPCVSVTFLYGVLGQVWYLIALIPDRCFLSHLDSSKRMEIVSFR